MSTKPAMLIIYALLAVFVADIVWLFYVAYIRDRRKW